MQLAANETLSAQSVVCNSCFTAHSSDETGNCTRCGAGICGLNGCTGECICELGPDNL